MCIHSDESVLKPHDDDFELDVLGIDLLLLVKVRTTNITVRMKDDVTLFPTPTTY